MRRSVPRPGAPLAAIRTASQMAGQAARLLALALALAACRSSTAPEEPPGGRERPENPWGASFGAGATDSARTPRALALAADAGIGWVRFMFGYSRIATAPGVYRYEIWDAMVAATQGEGIQILGQLGMASAWNTTAPPGDPDPIIYPPRDYDAWAEYVARTVARYPQIRYWEVWNEPDLPGYWRGSPAQYARLLATAYAAVKRANPEAKVLLGGLALGGRLVDPDFLDEILADPSYPATRSFDIANIHVYGSRQEAERRFAYVRAALARAGAGDRPIWVTEAGYPSDPADQNDPAYVGPAGQAAWLRDRLPYLRELGAEKVFWFKLYDSESGPGAVEKSFGLLDGALRPKPAYDAYRELIARRG